MNTATLKADLRNLFPKKRVSDPELSSIMKSAFLEMAHYIDLPDAQDFPDDITVVSGTPNYAVTLTSGKDIDRITSGVFVGGTNKRILGDSWTIRTYMHAYKGVGSTGLPTEMVYYNDELWVYPIPSSGGTIYTSCQHVLTDLTDFPDNYYPLMEALVKLRVYANDEDFKWNRTYRHAKDLVKSFKGRMHPKKIVMEKSGYRAQKMQDINAQI